MKKGKPWNLTPLEWSEVLKTGSGAQEMADEIQEEKLLPWVPSLLSSTGPDDEVLDLGSGAGQNSAFLALHGRKTTLLDWSKRNVEFSSELFGLLGIKGRFIQADMTRPLPFEDASFDSVFSCGVFEYFTDFMILQILREAFRISRKRVIIMVPNAASIPYRLGMWYMKRTNTWHWGGERPYFSFKPYFKELGNYSVREFSIGTRHSLNFLKMPMGQLIRNGLIRAGLKDHSGPAFLRQGYLLFSIAGKECAPC